MSVVLGRFFVLAGDDHISDRIHDTVAMLRLDADVFFPQRFFAWILI